MKPFGHGFQNVGFWYSAPASISGVHAGGAANEVWRWPLYPAHGISAGSAADFLLQRMILISDRTAFRCPYCRLCAVKFFPRYNALMGILYNDPVLPVNPNHMGMTDSVTSMLSIDNPADIPFIPQDAINQTTRPKVFIKQIVPLGTGDQAVSKNPPPS